MIYITGDLHGGQSAYHVTGSRFRPAKRGDTILVTGDFGAVWYHDYHTNPKHRKAEDGWLDVNLKRRVKWLAVDGNHENFARLFGGEFPLVEIYGGLAYQVRPHAYYLKRGEIFDIEGKRFLAFGGATSHDRFGSKCRSLSWSGGYDIIPPRVEGKDWCLKRYLQKRIFKMRVAIWIELDGLWIMLLPIRVRSMKELISCG